MSKTKTDRVDFGSDEHAQLLGLRKLEKDEKAQYNYNGWTLTDLTQFGATARPEYIQAQLVQRVNELTTKPSVPANAPEMWKP